jgi:F-type H+-transporting ATPase subunit delta
MKNDTSYYVDKVINLVCKKDELDQILFDASLIKDRLSYRTVVKNGADESKKEILVLHEIENLGSDQLKTYFRSLIKEKDLHLFDPGVFKVFYESLMETAEKILFFHITTAILLKQPDIIKLSKKLSEKMERHVIIDLRVDKTIIGGAIIKKDNYILDFSLRTKLSTLSSEWKKSIKAEEAHA